VRSPPSGSPLTGIRTVSSRAAGRPGIFFSGMVNTIRSTPRTASGTETAVAPVSAARSESVSGARELATKTSCPSPVKWRVSVPPIWPVPGCQFSLLYTPRAHLIEGEMIATNRNMIGSSNRSELS
jgi:hypothetical protein